MHSRKLPGPGQPFRAKLVDGLATSRSVAISRGVVLTCWMALWGCASYVPEPLPTMPDRGAAANAAGSVRERAPLGMNEVATLAVLNNPALNAARAKSRVAAAQAFDAGILPEPQFGASTDVPYDRLITPRDPRYPEYHAYGFTLGIDVRALLTHSSRRKAADASYAQAQAELLWQEWQTVARARTLYVAESIAAERIALLTPAEHQYALAAAHSQRALERHDATLDRAGADAAALAVIRTQLGVASREELKAQHALRALLGLEPNNSVALKPLGVPVAPERAQVAAAAARLNEVRPDLLALRQGYASQEAQVRVAVLSQFPNVVVGFNRARDVSDVHTNGGMLSMNLPLFDASRGTIAIEKATRSQLFAEYVARLDQARADVWTLWDEIAALQAQLADLDTRLTTLRQAADSSRVGFSAGNLAAASYFVSVNALLSAQATRFELLQSLWNDAIALATVSGTQVSMGA